MPASISRYRHPKPFSEDSSAPRRQLEAAYHLQLTVAAVARAVHSSAGALRVSSESVLSRPGCCSPRRRLPGGASSRYRAVGRRRRGHPASRHAHGVGRRCPPCGVHPSDFGVRVPAVQPSGVRSPGVVVQRVRRSVVCLSTRPVSSRVVSVHIRPDASVSSMLRRWRWDQVAVAGRPLSTGTGGGPGGWRAVDGSIDGQRGRDAGDAAAVASVNGR